MYRLLAHLHWTARLRSIERTLHELQGSELSSHRFVDVGCGPAWLATLAQSLCCEYLGVDPALRKAREVPGGRIEPLDANSVLNELQPTDIVVLNGVAHHLDDVTFQRLLKKTRDCTALVLCDHRAEPSNHHINKLLQRYDRGNFVRPYSSFSQLSGYKTTHLDSFEIKWLGIPVWSYFTGLYHPTRSTP